MKYVLIYEFDVEIYRRAPTVRIYLNDVMLTDVVLDGPKKGSVTFDYIPSDINNLEIEFVNGDNNYTNGFMTKSTYIKPVKLYILPYSTAIGIQNYKDRYECVFGKKNHGIYRHTGKIWTARNNILKGYKYIAHYYKERTQYPENLARVKFGLFDIFKSGESKKYQITLRKKHNVLVAKQYLGYWKTVHGEIADITNWIQSHDK